MLVGLALVTPAARADSDTEFGAYRGGGAAPGVTAFEQWVGTEAKWSLDFLPGDTWATIESPVWMTQIWEPSGFKAVYSVPLIPATGGSLAEGASGAYNQHFTTLAQTLVAGGEGDAVLRLGWEFNGRWYRWAASADPAAFAAYWRQIVTTMRAVPGAAFQFDWCPTLGTEAVAPDLAYPGDAYVDYIGLDIYDQSWAQGWEDPVQRWNYFLTRPHGLRWHRDFAAAHGKQMTYPEWGLAQRDDGHGGGDDPYFVQKMHEWIAANDVAYALYFEYDESDSAHRLMTGRFPQAAAKYLQLFGRSLPSAPPPPLPPPPPPPPVPPPPPPPVGDSAVVAPGSRERPAPSGRPVKAHMLATNGGTWSGSGPMTFTYSWQRCNAAGADCKPIPGASSASYVIQRKDEARTLRVGVTARNAAGTATQFSAVTAVVARRTGASSSAELGQRGLSVHLGFWRRVSR